LFNKKDFSDITIKIEGKEIYAHKNILAAQCERFFAMFTSDMSEGCNNEIIIEDYSFEVVKAMIEFFYCAQIDVDRMGYKTLIEFISMLLN